MLVDSHCHLDFPGLVEQLPAVIDRAKAAGVEHLLCIGVNLEDFKKMMALLDDYPNVFASVGIHPNTPYQEEQEPDAGALAALASDPRVVAIGETGLDFFRSKGDLEWQKQRFKTHIEAATFADKPLIIHTREAAQATLDVMRAASAQTVGGVMHCFADEWEVAKAALDLGFFISFSGIVTFKSADSLREVARRVPDDRILIETDAPYLAPVPHRGKTNEPAFVRATAACLAELRGQSLAEIGRMTTENFFALFSSATRISSKSVPQHVG